MCTHEGAISLALVRSTNGTFSSEYRRRIKSTIAEICAKLAPYPYESLLRCMEALHYLIFSLSKPITEEKNRLSSLMRTKWVACWALKGQVVLSRIVGQA